MNKGDKEKFKMLVDAEEGEDLGVLQVRGREYRRYILFTEDDHMFRANGLSKLEVIFGYMSMVGAMKARLEEQGDAVSMAALAVTLQSLAEDIAEKAMELTPDDLKAQLNLKNGVVK